MADTMLPDPGVLAPDEEAAEVAAGVLSYWERQAELVGETIGRVARDELPLFRQECIAALVRRIHWHRATRR